MFQLLGFLVFICAASDGNFVHWHGGGWLIFVGLVSFVCNVGLYLMYLFQYSRSLPASVNMPIAVGLPQVDIPQREKETGNGARRVGGRGLLPGWELFKRFRLILL